MEGVSPFRLFRDATTISLGCAGLVLGCGNSDIHMLVNEFAFALSALPRRLGAKVQMRHYVSPMPFFPVL